MAAGDSSDDDDFEDVEEYPFDTEVGAAVRIFQLSWKLLVAAVHSTGAFLGACVTCQTIHLATCIVYPAPEGLSVSLYMVSTSRASSCLIPA